MILDACRATPSITIPELVEKIGVTERSIQRNIQKLQAGGLLQSMGGREEGCWEVRESDKGLPITSARILQCNGRFAEYWCANLLIGKGGQGCHSGEWRTIG
jgi:DeoR/GlpR family transcriptional regulator of sugar metabolism